MRNLSLLGAIVATMVSSAAAARPLVAVIDSGIAATAELAPYLVGEVDAAAWPARRPLQPRFDHGTKVATVLVRSASLPVNLLSVRVDEPAGCPPHLNPPCQHDPEVIAWAIYAAAAHGADVINISMTLPDAPVIRRAVAFASWNGADVVLAAGNDGRSVPANLSLARAGYPRAVLVGAVEFDGRRWRKSNHPPTDATDGYRFTWRWGVEVPTAQADGLAVRASGTSIAAPIEAAERAVRHSRRTSTRLAITTTPGDARRPVMLAAAVYPDVRARRCVASLRRGTAATCFGSTLIA